MTKRKLTDEYANCLSELLACEIDITKPHVLKNSRILPCNNKACLGCIKSKLVNGRLRCGFKECGKLHVIDDINSLPIDKKTDIFIQKNRKIITSNIFTNICDTLEEFKSKFDNHLASQSEKYEFLKEEIIIRVESLKAQLDNLQGNLIECVENIKTNHEAKFKQDFDKIESSCTKFKNSISLLDDQKKEEWMLQNENLYKCDEEMGKLNQFNFEMKETFDSITFEDSDWLPNTDSIGCIIGQNLTNSLLKVKQPYYINLSDVSDGFTGICPIDESNLAICDEEKIFILNNDFEIVDVISKIGVTKINPKAICKDDEQNVYICDSESSRILVMSNDFKLLKLKMKHANLKRPHDIAYNQSRIYVLDSLSKAIFVFTTNGTIKTILKLRVNNTYLVNPIQFAMMDDKIAVVDNYEKIYFFNIIDGAKNFQLGQVLDIVGVNSCCFYENYFYAGDVELNLILFKKDDDGNFKENLFNGKITDCEGSTFESLSVFNGQILAVTDDSKLVVFA